MKINGRAIGAGHPTYVVAELSANHGGSLERSIELVHAAKKAGADAVKVQTYTADSITISCDSELFQIKGGTLWDGRDLYRLYDEAHMPWEWQPKLKEVSNRLGMDFFSAAFDFGSVDFLSKMGVPVFKVASPEIVDLPLVEKIARAGKPMILSTGMASLEEITDAVKTAKKAGATDIALLKCTSAYPAPADEMNLKTISDLNRIFGVPVGLSDHTLGFSVPVAAIMLGAAIVEKHFTLSRNDPTPDSAFSLEPDEFSAMVSAIRTVEKAIGEAKYGPTPHEKPTLEFRRSLFVVEDMKAGEVITERNIRSIRPAHGLPPKHFHEVLGRKVVSAVKRGTPLSWKLIEKE